MTIQAKYERQREWSDQFIKPAKRVLGERLFQIADDELDMHQATDLIIEKYRVSLRFRDIKYFKFQDFTIRISHDRGGVTEYEKMLSTHAPHYLFYGYVDKTEIIHGYLVDVNEWRSALKLGLIDDKNRTYQNDRTAFVAFPFNPIYTEKLV